MEYRKVYLVNWEESERGWGTKPDGYSLHISEDVCEKYMRSYWNSQPPTVPEVYSRQNSPGTFVEVGKKLYNKIVKNGGSYRTYNLVERIIVDEK